MKKQRIYNDLRVKFIAINPNTWYIETDGSPGP